MPNAKYAFASAYLKGAEAKVLTAEHIDKMSRISNIQDVVASVREILEIIKDTDAGRYLEEALVKTFDDSDRFLWYYFNGCLERLEWLKLLPDDMRKVLRAYMVKYDVINIYTQGLLDELSAAEGADDVIRVPAACRLGDYADILRGYSEQDAKSRFVIEAKLDGRYYENLLTACRRISDGALLIRAFSIIIDMTNLALISRAVIENMGSRVDESIIGGGYMISDKVAKDALSHKLADIPSA